MSSERRVSMTIGLSRHPSVRALIDGVVKPEGIDLTCVSDFPEPYVIVLCDRILEDQLDGGEFSMSIFTQSKLLGAPLVGIPVFPFRSFRHRSVYCYDGSGIRTPEDLKGKRLGVHAYRASTMTWVRGILRDEFGVQPHDIRWYTLVDKGADGARQSGVSIELLPSPGMGVDFIEHVARIIERGELDGGISPFDISRLGIHRLFPNAAEMEASYYRRTGIVPTIHTVVVNERIVRDHPWVLGSLLEAFRKASALTPQYATGSELEGWDKEMWEVDRPILGGDDLYACGLGARERCTVEAFLDYLFLDGAIKTKPAVDSLFPVG